MNFKVGVDIIEIDRVKESVESERFCERVYRVLSRGGHARRRVLFSDGLEISRIFSS